MKRLAILAASAVIVALAVWSGTASAAVTPHPAPTGHSAISAMPILGHQTAVGAYSTTLSYKGGAVEATPAVYVSFWGSEWASGFSTGGYTSRQAQAYILGFFNRVGGTHWANIDHQYCYGVAYGSGAPCPSTAKHIGNPTGQLKGQWNDTTVAVPAQPGDYDIQLASYRLMLHFGYNPNATYLVYTPSGKSTSGFGTYWCAYHGAWGSASSPVQYANMPYMPDAGGSCGMNFVNAQDNARGNGYFDGFSIVSGHEYAEAVTDPGVCYTSCGWLTSGFSEIGDLCAWSSMSTNIAFPNGTFYAVQPLWSDAVNGCALRY